MHKYSRVAADDSHRAIAMAWSSFLLFDIIVFGSLAYMIVIYPRCPHVVVVVVAATMMATPAGRRSRTASARCNPRYGDRSVARSPPSSSWSGWPPTTALSSSARRWWSTMAPSSGRRHGGWATGCQGSLRTRGGSRRQTTHSGQQRPRTGLDGAGDEIIAQNPEWFLKDDDGKPCINPTVKTQEGGPTPWMIDYRVATARQWWVQAATNTWGSGAPPGTKQLFNGYMVDTNGHHSRPAELLYYGRPVKFFKNKDLST